MSIHIKWCTFHDLSEIEESNIPGTLLAIFIEITKTLIFQGFYFFNP
jgi:hypothetical protein